jgi:hypothetical protein
MAAVVMDEEQPVRPDQGPNEGLLCLAPPMRQNRRKVAWLVGAAVLAAIAVIIAVAVAIVRPSAHRYTTQGPNIAFSTLFVDGVGESPWVLLDWTSKFDWDNMSDIIVEGAPQVLIFDDLIGGGHGAEGHSSSEYPWDFTNGSATRSDGTVAYEYAANTTQELDWTKPQNISFTIDGAPYDLSEGTLFLIRTADGVSVQQIDADMPYFHKSDDVIEAVEEFAASNDDILAFLKEISASQDRK